MRITQEADYAIRISAALAQINQKTGAPKLSEELCIPLSFTSKILKKLMLSGIVQSARGAGGGFFLAKDSSEITLKQIVEAIDGPIAIRHCLDVDHNCSYQPNKEKCRFHCVFQEINCIITNCLDIFSLKDMTNADIPINELIERLHN